MRRGPSLTAVATACALLVALTLAGPLAGGPDGRGRIAAAATPGADTTAIEASVASSPATVPGAPPTHRAPLPRINLDLGAVAPPPESNPDLPPVEISGSGWGHSVGMSQYGALAMARAGYDHPEILAHYFPGTELGTHRMADRTLRIHLLLARKLDHSRQRLTSAGGPLEVRARGELVAEIPVDEVWTARADGGRTALHDADGELVHVTAGRFDVTWGGDGSRVLVLPDVKELPNASGEYAWGRMELGSRSGRLHPVLSLGVEEYLRGLAEMPASWTPAAQRAQAVAGRTYALRHLAEGLDIACRCHMGATPHFQAYRGLAHEAGPHGSTWTAAVRATSGQVLTYGGELAWTYYSSSHGGHSEAAIDSWAFDEDLPYLPAVDDPWSLDDSAGNPRAMWDRELPNSLVASAFGLAAVTAIEVLDRTAGGTPLVLRATGYDADGNPAVADFDGGEFGNAGAAVRMLIPGRLPSQQIDALRIAPFEVEVGPDGHLGVVSDEPDPDEPDESDS